MDVVKKYGHQAPFKKLNQSGQERLSLNQATTYEGRQHDEKENEKL